MTVRDEVYTLLQNPMDLPSEFWAYATQSWLKDSPVFPISQVFGFTQFLGNFAIVGTDESTTTTTVGDNLATVGPTLSGLADGKYFFAYGFTGKASAAGFDVIAGLNINGTAPTVNPNDPIILTEAANYISVTGAFAKTLSNAGSNTVKMQYWVSGGTGNYQRRFIFGLKYANN